MPWVLTCLGPVYAALYVHWLGLLYIVCLLFGRTIINCWMYSLTNSSQQSTGTCVLCMCAFCMLKWPPTSHGWVCKRSREVYGLASVVFFTLHDTISTVFSYWWQTAHNVVEAHHYICAAVPNCTESREGVGLTSNVLRRLTYCESLYFSV